MRKRFLLCGLVAIASFNLASCEDDETPINNTPSTLSAKFIEASDCLRNVMSDMDEEVETSSKVVYKYNAANGEVELNLEDFVLNYGVQDPYMDFTFNGDTISINVLDKNDSEENVAKCFCYYNLSSIVSGAESKTYYLNISSRYTKNASVVIDLSKKAEDKIEY